ncbi:MAG TPA: DNA repair protein RecO [Roseiflexaceae bacterium]|nr:DNA repair protein RecO [Roseiflexaceae bacterium]
MRDRVYRTEGVIIRRSAFGESDRLLTVYTPQGKRRVVAKGASKTTSRLAGHIELFTHAQLLLAVGRNLDIVTQSTVVHDYTRLRGDLKLIGAAYYAAELLDRLTEEEDANPKAFRVLVAALGALDRSETPDLVLRWYELHVLDAQGFRPQLSECVVCQDLLTEDANRFSPTGGGVLCQRCAQTDTAALPMSLGAFKLLRYLQQQPDDVLDRLKLSMAVRHEAEQLLRALIRRILERDLKSIAFLEEVQQQP